MPTKTTFSCGEALDIVHVGPLRDRLRKALEKSYTIELKADKVEKADTAGLQLFVILAKTVKQHNGSLIWKKPSDALLATAKSLGLHDQLHLS